MRQRLATTHHHTKRFEAWNILKSRRYNKNETYKEFRARLTKEQYKLAKAWHKIMIRKYWPEYREKNA